VPIIIAQHCGAQKPDLLAAVLRAACKLRVKEAEDGEHLGPGCIYIAPAARHVAIEQPGYITIRDGARIRYSRPSIDLLFSSAAETYRDRMLGVVLTGANEDGANGAFQIDLLGGIVIAQRGAEYPQMPTAAVATGAVHHQLPLETLSCAIIALCMLPGAASWMQRFTTEIR
jgi:two-component system chemotaxis response regulator CheB